MNWRHSRLGRVWSSVSNYGLSAGLQDALARWSRQRLGIAQDVLGDYSWALNEDRPATLRAPATGPLKINWLVPNVSKASGGLLTLTRAIYHLERWGHQHRIYLVGRTTLSGTQATELVRKYYFPIKAEVELFSGAVADSDALVATLWRTAYAARALGNTARKFYFVNDLEHLFYPEGSLCEFARQTYRWGFHGIAVGQWIADVLHSEFGMECSAFGFSYDRGIYSPNGSRRLPDAKKRVLFYARATSERRGFELGVLALSLVAKKMPDTEFVLLGFPPRSIQLPFAAILPGTLTIPELAALYRSCNVALVLSLTNLSLLPLELMACGCAVVSNSGPNVEWLLSDETTQLASPTPEALADAILALLSNEQLRSRKAAAGLAFAEGTNWTSEIKAIEAAFYRGLNVPFPDKPSEARAIVDTRSNS
jgi:glycosyltransferase involved in cell wall biosynthesis